MMKIATVVVGTKSFVTPMRVCVRRVDAAVKHASAKRNFEHVLVVVTDKKSTDSVKEFAPSATVIGLDVEEDGELYGKERQLLIARLQSSGFNAARDGGCTHIWSVESDVLPPPNALSCSLDMLDFDDGYYDVAFCTYPSHGGGSFLGGHGSPERPIEEDFLPHERDLPERLVTLMDKTEDALHSAEANGDRAAFMKASERARRLHKKCQHFPPKGNVFALNANGWRRRGWLNYAYPGIGKGCVVPTDWTGLGCTLMSPKATKLADFEGYDGRGTQDLFLNFKKWSGLRFCCITHCPCDHIVRDKDAPNGLAVLNAYHQPSGETKGHLRMTKNEFHVF